MINIARIHLEKTIKNATEDFKNPPPPSFIEDMKIWRSRFLKNDNVWKQLKLFLGIYDFKDPQTMHYLKKNHQEFWEGFKNYHKTLFATLSYNITKNDIFSEKDWNEANIHISD